MFQVSKLSHLKILNLAHNSIVTMEGLKELKLLTWLSLASNSLKGIENLNQNIHLEHLDLADNVIQQITDISYLKNLKVSSKNAFKCTFTTQKTMTFSLNKLIFCHASWQSNFFVFSWILRFSRRKRRIFREIFSHFFFFSLKKHEQCSEISFHSFFCEVKKTIKDRRKFWSMFARKTSFSRTKKFVLIPSKWTNFVNNTAKPDFCQFFSKQNMFKNVLFRQFFAKFNWFFKKNLIWENAFKSNLNL